MNGKGGVKTPPYKTNLKWSTSGPMTSIGPYSMGAEEFRPRRGQYGERAKSVKKNAALLHFLAFGPFDHNFGVPRGE